MNETLITCKFCQESKSPESFSPNKLSKCKKCCAQYIREKRANNHEFREKERLAKQEKRKDPEVKAKEKASRIKYTEKNRAEINRKSNERQALQPELRKERKRSWYLRNRESEIAKASKRRKENPEQIINYYKSDRAKDLAKKARERRKLNNPLYKIRINLRSRIRIAFRYNFKSKRTSELVGCSWEFLKSYLEERFQEGMSWENYGMYGWHIDHIRPLSLAENQEELEKLCHYSNLQPLWAKENWSKASKIVDES